MTLIDLDLQHENRGYGFICWKRLLNLETVISENACMLLRGSYDTSLGKQEAAAVCLQRTGGLSSTFALALSF